MPACLQSFPSRAGTGEEGCAAGGHDRHACAQGTAWSQAPRSTGWTSLVLRRAWADGTALLFLQPFAALGPFSLFWPWWLFAIQALKCSCLFPSPLPVCPLHLSVGSWKGYSFLSGPQYISPDDGGLGKTLIRAKAAVQEPIRIIIIKCQLFLKT